MGDRPADFDEDLVRESSAFQNWETLTDGEALTFNGRRFIKGKTSDDGGDEERLMRKIFTKKRPKKAKKAKVKHSNSEEVEDSVSVGEIDLDLDESQFDLTVYPLVSWDDDPIEGAKKLAAMNSSSSKNAELDALFARK